MKDNDYQKIKIFIMVGALVLAILWGMKVLNVLEAGLKLIEIKTGISYFTI